MLDKEFYTPKEVAVLMSVNFRTVLNMIHSGRLKASNFGSEKRGLYRIAREDIEKLRK